MRRAISPKGASGNFDFALFAAPLFRETNQSMALQQPHILLDVLQVPIDDPGEFVNRSRVLGTDCPHQSDPLLGKKVARGLKTGEIHPFARLELLFLLGRFEGLLKIVTRLDSGLIFMVSVCSCHMPLRPTPATPHPTIRYNLP